MYVNVKYLLTIIYSQIGSYFLSFYFSVFMQKLFNFRKDYGLIITIVNYYGSSIILEINHEGTHHQSRRKTIVYAGVRNNCSQISFV